MAYLNINVDIDIDEIPIKEVLDYLEQVYLNPKPFQIKIQEEIEKFLIKIKIPSDENEDFEASSLLDTLKMDFIKKNFDKLNINELEKLV